jgi:hypothetical protein
MDELPRLRNVDFDQELPEILKESSKNILKSLVSMRRYKILNNQNSSFSTTPGLNHNNRSTSMNYIPSSEQVRSNNNYNGTVHEVARQRQYDPLR